ncbi:ribonuclease [Chitinimonas arctica]|uniref:Ribonuclease n=1 Tax=Chitinimonas arctica TaxID=2594795 RepID=A0A516SHJ6_9NEIS|nr:ribonuclease domain-containing protein [Chitinimonas arctica]QDQ27627.1 ribonuclease [Chitinimonas arctica]
MRLLFALLLTLPAMAAVPDCRSVSTEISRRLDAQLDIEQLSDTLSALNRDGQLPQRFVTKQAARAAGWQPGKPLDSIPALKGKAIGGDRFGNYERLLPNGNWREADLDYRGGKRGPKRLVFEPVRDGHRYITVNHYQQFTEIPPCR